jgi:acid stress chaperone HdeB
MKSMTVTCIAAGLLAGNLLPAARAETIDLARIKCAEFLTTSKEEITYTLAWLDAYHKEDDDPLIVDSDKVQADAKKLEDFCAANPNVGVMSASEKLFNK